MEEYKSYRRDWFLSVYSNLTLRNKYNNKSLKFKVDNKNTQKHIFEVGKVYRLKNSIKLLLNENNRNK